MCLAIPGKVLAIDTEEDLLRLAQVDFSGLTKQISLAYTPEAQIGDYVLVHVGFAISVLNEKEAQRVLTALAQIAENHEILD